MEKRQIRHFNAPVHRSWEDDDRRRMLANRVWYPNQDQHPEEEEFLFMLQWGYGYVFAFGMDMEVTGCFVRVTPFLWSQL